MRVRFCGVIEGSVAVRPGESHEDALARAEAAINEVLDRSARLYKRTAEDGGGTAPVVGLELYE